MSKISVYEAEWKKAQQWALDEIDKVTEKLKREGRLGIGMDTNNIAYHPIWEELDRRRIDIQRRMKDDPDVDA